MSRGATVPFDITIGTPRSAVKSRSASCACSTRQSRLKVCSDFATVRDERILFRGAGQEASKDAEGEQYQVHQLGQVAGFEIALQARRISCVHETRIRVRRAVRALQHTRQVRLATVTRVCTK